MNIHVLAASVLSFAVLAPAANAAPVQHPVKDSSHVERCLGNYDLGTMECKVSPASDAIMVPLTEEISSADIDRGTGGSGTAAGAPQPHNMPLVMKPNPDLDRGSNSHPSQL